MRVSGLKSFVQRALKSVGKKKVLASVAVVAAVVLTGVTMQAVRAERPDCDSNAVLYCGAYDVNTLVNKYNANPSAQAIYASSPFGISATELKSGGYVNGSVTRSNQVYVNGRLVATGALTAGRHNMGGSHPLPGGPGYYRPPSVSFKQSSLSAFVKLDGNGRFMFAIIKACGNPVVGNPTTPPQPPKPAPKPNFTIQKKVRIAGTKNNYGEDVKVQPGQKVEYVVAVQNTGNVQLTGVKVHDTLPSGMTYVTNSTYMVNSWDGRHGLPNGITTKDGIGIGRIPAGETVFVFFNALAPKETQPGLKMCSTGKSVYRNVAYAKPVELGEKSDDANINTCIPNKPDFKITKLVRVAGTNDEFKKQVTAAPGTELEYVFAVQNTGNVDIPNVLVKDILPGHVTFVPGSAKITVSGGVKDQPLPDSLVTTGYTVPVLKKGATAFVFLHAKLPVEADSVVVDCKVGKTKLTNKAQANPVGPLGPKEDTADAYTCKVVKVPNFTIVKDVRKKGDADWKQDVTVKYGDSVEYKISVTNTGELDLKNVLVKDAQPTGVDYVAGSLKVNGSLNNGDLFGSGITLPEIKVGTKAEITFEAKVAATQPEPCKDASYKNIASALPEGLTKKEDDAVVKVNCVVIEHHPKVEIVKTATKAVVDVNGQFAYTLVVTNKGDIDLTNVKVTDPAPEGIKFLSASKPDGTVVTVTPTNFEATIAKLNKDQSVTFDIQSQVTKQLPEGVDNTACVDAPEVPGTPDDCDTVKVKTPFYECVALNKLALGDFKYRFSTQINKSETVNLTSISYNFGDGSDVVLVNNQSPVEHQFDQTKEEATYTIVATVTFSVDGQTKQSTCQAQVKVSPLPEEVCPYNPNLPKDSPYCFEPCPYNPNLPKDSKGCVPPVHPPKNPPAQPPVNVVPNTGMSGAATGVIGSSVTVYAAYAWLESRRALKRK
jgi:uncharacterized repeat protein (TIGR01451 family)